ncbi:MAG TPA: VOC family protein [Acetobacteraceae bacterium]|nr:VOC family protein [Acetobacteraceae bacterium]
MANGPLGLEHPLVVSDDLDALAERYRALGFAPTRKGYHPWGTGTQLVLFSDNFIELMGINDRRLIDTPSETGFRFGRFIADQLDRREGIAMIALHSEDAAADAAAVTARGVEPDGLVNFRREVTLPDGAKDEAVVSLALLIDWEQPQLSHFICQQHRPEFVWVREWMQHPNGAQAIARVVYAAAEPHAYRQRFAGIWGEEALHDLDNGFRVATAGGELLMLDRPAAEARFAPVEMPYGWRDAPCAVAITVRVADVNRVHLMMMQNRVPHVRMADRLRIPPAHAGNVILDFVA